MNTTLVSLLVFGYHHSLFAPTDIGSDHPIRSTGILKSKFQTKNYLQRYGYLSFHNIPEAIAEFQRRAHIPITGFLDGTTLDVMKEKRCGVPDISHIHVSSHSARLKRYVLHRTRWKYINLTYCIKTYPSSLDTTNDGVDSALAKAFKIWSDVSALTFTQLQDCSVDIVIEFKSGEHGDKSPFDGPGHALAHAFYPGNNNRGLHGDIHLDDDEAWTDAGNRPKKEDIFCVAVHEIGHSIGLQHSDVRGSIMWPWARKCIQGNPLTRDDTRAIQAVYGPRKDVTVTSTPTPTTTVRRDPGDCQGWVDSVTIGADGRTYAFRDILVYRFDSRGVASGYPKVINEVFPGGPRTVDTSVTLSLRTRPGKRRQLTFLFKGPTIYVYDYDSISGHFTLYKKPGSVKHELDLPTRRLDSAFFLNEEDTCYFISGHVYWTVTIDEEGYAHTSRGRSLSSLRELRNVPVFRSAVRMPNGLVYLFYEKHFFRFQRRRGSRESRRRLIGPMSTSYWWFQC